MDAKKILDSIEKMRANLNGLSTNTSTNNQFLIQEIFSTIGKLDKDLDVASKTLENLTKLKENVQNKIQKNYLLLTELNKQLQKIMTAEHDDTVQTSDKKLRSRVVRKNPVSK